MERLSEKKGPKERGHQLAIREIVVDVSKEKCCHLINYNAEVWNNWFNRRHGWLPRLANYSRGSNIEMASVPNRALRWGCQNASYTWHAIHHRYEVFIILVTIYWQIKGKTEYFCYAASFVKYAYSEMDKFWVSGMRRAWKVWKGESLKRGQ